MAILPEHLPEDCLGCETARPAVPGGDIVPLDEVEDRYLRWAAARFRGEKRELAKKLGLSERTFYRKLSKVRSESQPVAA